MRPRIFTVPMIATATLLAMMGVLTSTSVHSVNAQMMIGDHSGFGNMTSGLQQKIRGINGTINIEGTSLEAIGSKGNTSLTQAMTIAERSVGNNSSALAAFGNDRGGYFVYHIILGTPAMEFYNVMVDPGNGQILATQETSKKELEKMHLDHSYEVMRGGGSVGGFPLLIPH